jgi:hypothetical protein
MAHLPDPAPTQVAHPWKATIRTIIQTFLSVAAVLALVAPELQGFVDEWWPRSPAVAWIGIGAAFVASVAGVLTRIMAIPAVNEFLTRFGLGASPR